MNVLEPIKIDNEDFLKQSQKQKKYFQKIILRTLTP